MSRAAFLLLLALCACAAPMAEAPALDETTLEAPVMLAPMDDAGAIACPTVDTALDDGIGGTGCR